MSFRIAIGGLVHEANTYCQGTPGLDVFEVLRGQDLAAAARAERGYLGGMFAAADALGAEAIPTLFAITEPDGPMAARAYETLLAELLDRIEAAMPVQAVGLYIHGAGIAEGIDDLEAHMCRAIRKRVGPDVKIVACMDLHGNITQAMANELDCFFGVHYYPHTDGYDRGFEAVMAVPGLLNGSLRPVTHVETVPMLISPSTTDHGPAKAVNALCREVEQQNGVIDCTFFHGFPYADNPLVGAHVVCTANGDEALAQAGAKRVAQWIWDHRDAFRSTELDAPAAVAAAMAAEGRPIVINDTADNPGGGAPGDGTHLLRALLEANVTEACFGFIYDPEVVAAAHAAGVGTTIDVRLGGKSDALHGEPLPVTAYVKTLTDGQFELHAIAAGAIVNLGRTARLQIGGIDVIVSSVRTQTLDPEVFLLHGIDVQRCKIVALKSSHHFRAGFAPIADRIITADSPGLTTLDVTVFPRERTPRPIWPLDADATYEGARG